ncbi:toll/interleukin-1 receptor domain-containing protein [Lichenibacterium minor]|uniref:Toll/interleukin-1 receptor domain-containing protein n=1 Tax=Lichenibacterium minor TaxID=2316528 RepID=A0A4Q2TZP6_9HYPH|nr:toll/interleukin-1 receptor domain-containing protein [Lichenibacterium minor]RYC29623.1 toll/interleukin-1 receptor domain-containing protein [Lichenibacterium minor]
MPVRVFISYSHKDAAFRHKLEVHLAVLKRDGIIETFFDGDIDPGQGLNDSIKRELRDAEVFVALASPEYLHSSYCFVKEYQYALRRAARKTMHVVVAVIRPCGWKHTRMGHYKALPEDGKEVTTWGNRDSAFEDIVNGVRRVVKLAEASQRERVSSAAKARTASKALPTRVGAAKVVKPVSPPKAKKPDLKPAAKAVPKKRAQPTGAKVTRSPATASRDIRRRKSPA